MSNVTFKVDVTEIAIVTPNVSVIQSIDTPRHEINPERFVFTDKRDGKPKMPIIDDTGKRIWWDEPSYHVDAKLEAQRKILFKRKLAGKKC